MIDKGNYATGKAWLGVKQEYARIIHGNVWVRTQSLSKNLASLKVAVGYGHTTIGVSASANVTASSAGLGVDFSVKQSEEYYETKTYRY